jgi:membrane protease subunit HflC
MKNIGTIIAAVVLAVVLVAYMFTFQVRFTQTAIRVTWGKPSAEAINEPGLYFRWPWPIQSIVVYDRRVRILEDRTEETRTVDGKNLLLTTFTLWRIADPSTFHTNFPGGVEDGEAKLRTTIYTAKHAVVGKRPFSEFVSVDPAERKIRDIEKEMMAAVARDAEGQFGMKVEDFGIKKLLLPQSVTTAIFESMKSAEEKKARQYTSEGDARANLILSEARATEERIMAAARQKVSEIRNDAQRVVSDYYKEFNQHPELRIFLDTLRTVRDALRLRTTLILDTQDAPWNVFSPSAGPKPTFAPGAMAAPAKGGASD